MFKTILCVFWGAAVAFGMASLIRYESTPGASGNPLGEIPRGDVDSLPEALPKLLLFGHPLCPCTLTTIRQLKKVVAQCQNRLRAEVIFVCPDDEPQAWANSPSVRLAREIAGVEVKWDHQGQLAAQYGVRTSGHVLLYDVRGRLQFTGGISTSRGHEDENAGSARLMERVHEPVESPTATAPVFGCPLFGGELQTKSNGE